MNREPVSTYSDALRWLFTHASVEEWAFGEQAELPLVAKLVCDMFWLREADLIRDLRKLWNEALGPVVPVRRASRSGWR